MRLLNHLQEHYDAHLGAASATGISLFSGIQDRLINMFWAVLTGIIVFLAVYAFKKYILKLKVK